MLAFSCAVCGNVQVWVAKLVKLKVELPSRMLNILGHVYCRDIE